VVTAVDGATVRMIVLGAAQDGGRPQVGCVCAYCVAARQDPAERESPSSLAIVDDGGRQFWLLDLTPDFQRQYDWLMATLGPGYVFRGAVLTHAHIGHYLGLLQLGREVMGAHGVPIYASARMVDFLASAGPFSQLVRLGNIQPMVVRPDEPLGLAPAVQIALGPVPHRQEWSDTMAVTVWGPTRSVLYLPDIDSWQAWTRPLAEVVAGVDLAYLDGTFYSAEELPTRSRAEIPHPTVLDTVAALGGAGAFSPGKVFFIHLNHSNRLWDAAEVAALAARHGLGVARRGQQQWL